MKKNFCDSERFEFVRQFRLSGLTQVQFCALNGINRSTFRDWLNAYHSINGKFINVSALSEKPNCIVDDGEFRVNVLSEGEKIQKSAHFTRFDHSVVVIEYRDIKITTSLCQAERLLEKFL